METPEASPDPAYEARVVAYDEALAQGRLPNADSAAVPPRLAQAQSCLERLERDRQEAATDSALELVGLLHAEGLLERRTLEDAKFGRFRLRRELGRGGCGIVFLAWDPVLCRQVALKIPRLEVLVHPGSRQRFVREGRAAAGLAHPNIVSVLEAGEVGAISYIASAYCHGPSLAGWLKAQTAPVPQYAATHLLATVALALQQAHERGLIHRDLKPGNILLEPMQGSAAPPDAESGAAVLSLPLAAYIPRVTDFGLAKRIVGLAASGDSAAPAPLASQSLTHSGHALGTPAYMAPEQAAGKTEVVGPALDIWSLGVILYELLTGEAPFRGATEMDTLQQVIAADPVPPRRLRGDIARDLEVICLKCLQPLPQRRYGTMSALVDDLHRFQRGEPILARPIAALERGVLWARRRPAIAALAVSGLVACVTLFAGMIWHFEQLDARNVALQAAVARAGSERARAEAGERLAGMHAYASQIALAQELRSSGRPGLLREILARFHPGPTESDPRGFAWRFLWNVAGREVRLTGTHRRIDAVAFLADGRRAVAVDRLGTAVVWDVDRARLISQWDGNPVDAGQQVFSASGDRFISLVADGDGHSIRLCELSARRIIAARTWPGVHSVRLSPDGRTIAFTVRGSADVRLWDPQTDSERLLWQRRATTVTSLAFSADSVTLAIAYHQAQDPPLGVECVDVATGSKRAAMIGHAGLIASLAFSPDGATLACGCHQSGMVEVWDVASGRARATLHDLKETAYALAFSTDGTLLAGGSQSQRRMQADCFVCVWDLSKGGALHLAPFHRGADVASLTFAPTGKTLLVGDREGRVCVHHLDPPATEDVWAGHSPAEAWSVAFTPDSGRLISSGDAHEVKQWNVRTGALESTLSGHGSLVTAVAVAPDGRRWASGSYDGKVKVWDAASGKCLHTLAHAARVWSIAFASDSRTLAATGNDGSVRLWNIDTGVELPRLPQHHPRVCCTFVGAGTTLALGSDDGTVKMWDVATRVCRRVHDEGDLIHSVAASADGRVLAAGSGEGAILLRLTDTGARLEPLHGHTKRVKALAFSADGNLLASGGEDCSVRLWHVATGRELLCFNDLPHQVNSVAFAPDGFTLAAAVHDGTIHLWRGLEPAHSDDAK